MSSENQTQKGNSPTNEELLRQGVQLLHFLGKVMVAVGTQIQKIDEQNIKQFSAQKIQDIFREKE